MTLLYIIISIVLPTLLVVFFYFKRNASIASKETKKEIVEDKKVPIPTAKVAVKQAKAVKAKTQRAFNPKHELLVASLKGHSEPITCFCWSRDGIYYFARKLIATASSDRSIRVYISNTLTSTTPKYIRISTELEYVEAMDFSEDNRYLVCALGSSHAIAIYRVSMEGGVLFRNFEIERTSTPSHVFVSGSSDKMCILLVCSGNDTVLRLFDGSGNMRSRIDNAQLENYGSSFNYHRDYFATGSFGADTKIYAISRANKTREFSKFSKVMNLSGPRSSVMDVSFDQHDRAGVISKDGIFYIFTVDVRLRYQVQEDPHLLNQISFNGTDFKNVSLHPTENVALITGSSSCIIFNPLNGDILRTIDDVTGTSVKDVRTSADGAFFATLGNGEKQVNIWKFSS